MKWNRIHNLNQKHEEKKKANAEKNKKYVIHIIKHVIYDNSRLLLK